MYEVASKVKLCQRAYASITDLTLRTFQRYLEHVSKEEKPEAHVKPAGRKSFSDTSKTQLARAWFKHYTALHDYVPHKSRDGQAEVGAGLSLYPRTALLDRTSEDWLVPCP